MKGWLDEAKKLLRRWNYVATYVVGIVHDSQQHQERQHVGAAWFERFVASPTFADMSATYHQSVSSQKKE